MPWGTAAIVFPQAPKVFTFPIGEKPRVPQNYFAHMMMSYAMENGDVVPGGGADVTVSHEQFTEFVIARFISFLRDKNPDQLHRPMLSKDEDTFVAMSLMAISQLSGSQFWTVVCNRFSESNDEPNVELSFESFPAPSYEAGAALVDANTKMALTIGVIRGRLRTMH